MLPSPTNGIVFKIPQTHKYNDSTGKEHTAYHIHFTVDGGEEQMVMRSVENFRFFDKEWKAVYPTLDIKFPSFFLRKFRMGKSDKAVHFEQYINAVATNSTKLLLPLLAQFLQVSSSIAVGLSPALIFFCVLF